MIWNRIGLLIALVAWSPAAWAQSDCSQKGDDTGALCQTVEQAAAAQPADLEDALAHWMRGYPADSWPRLLPGTRELLGNIEGWHYWRAFGRDDLAREARSQAQALADRYGVDIAPALAVHVGYEVVPRERWEGERLGTVDINRRVSDEPAGIAKLPEGAILRPNHVPVWWTGYPEAYLDYANRVLPEAIHKAFTQHPDEPVFRLWHAGFEDASQTWLLAGMIDAAIPKLAQAHPEMKTFLDDLKVEIVGTDLLTRPVISDAGDVFFMSDQSAPNTSKIGLIPQEFGVGAPEQVAARVPALVAALDQAQGEARVPLLRELADAGGIPALMTTVLDPAPMVASARYHSQLFYRPSGWTVVDRTGETPRTYHEGHPQRHIEFQLADLTKAEPPHDVDAVVITEVLPWLRLYASVQRSKAGLPFEEVQPETMAAFDNLAKAMRPGGTWLVDMHSAELLRGERAYSAPPLSPAELSALNEKTAARGIQTWVTVPTHVETIQDYRKRDRLPAYEK